MNIIRMIMFYPSTCLYEDQKILDKKVPTHIPLICMKKENKTHIQCHFHMNKLNIILTRTLILNSCLPSSLMLLQVKDDRLGVLHNQINWASVTYIWKLILIRRYQYLILAISQYNNQISSAKFTHPKSKKAKFETKFTLIWLILAEEQNLQVGSKYSPWIISYEL